MPKDVVDVSRDPILRRDRDLLRRCLDRDARQLIAGRAFPLDLDAILNELGIELSSRPAERMGKAHGYLCQQDSRWQILVNASTSPARQRYTIAHELGHYMVKANLGFAPTNRAAYWMLEDVCQAFAADVLSPASLVEQLLADASRSPSGLLDVIPALIERTGLSLEAAARRVIEAADWPAGLLALDLGPVPRVDTASRAPASLRWIHASRPWIEAGRGKKLGPRHALWPAASAGRALGAGARAGLSLGGVTEALAERRASNLVLVAVALGPPSSPN